MEDLRAIMRLVDENAIKLPEGDYLEICNRLQSIFKTKEAAEMTPIFDYENFNFFVEDVTDTALDHFHDHYYTECIENDMDFLYAQKNYLKNELIHHKPITRVTKYVKHNAIMHYCLMHNITLDQYTPECLKEHHDTYGYNLGNDCNNFDKSLKQMYKSYLLIENHYRDIYRSSIRIKINKINGWIENFGDM